MKTTPKVCCCKSYYPWGLLIYFQILSVFFIFFTFFTDNWAYNSSVNASLLKISYNSETFNSQQGAAILCSSKSSSACILSKLLKLSLFSYAFLSLISVILILFWTITSISFIMHKSRLLLGCVLGALSILSYGIGLVLWIEFANVNVFSCSPENLINQLCISYNFFLNLACLGMLCLIFIAFCLIGRATIKALDLEKSAFAELETNGTYTRRISDDTCAYMEPI